MPSGPRCSATRRMTTALLDRRPARLPPQEQHGRWELMSERSGCPSSESRARASAFTSRLKQKHALLSMSMALGRPGGESVMRSPWRVGADRANVGCLVLQRTDIFCQPSQSSPQDFVSVSHVLFDGAKRRRARGGRWPPRRRLHGPGRGDADDPQSRGRKRRP